MADAVDLRVEYSTAVIKDEIKTKDWIADKNVSEIKLESSIDIKDDAIIQSQIDAGELKDETNTNKQMQYPCDMCNYKSTNMTYLRRHKKRHTGEKPFFCTTCRYTYIYKSNNKSQLEEHIKSHTRRENHHACDYKSHFFHNVVRHKEQYQSKQQLRQLYLRCKSCDYKSYLQSDLVEHVKCHAEQGQFGCAICDYKSTYKSKVMLHMKYRHKHEKQLVSL